MSLGRKIRSIALFEQLGPGLVTGAADDDPSGIATYSQTGARFGYGLLWTMPWEAVGFYAVIGRYGGDGDRRRRHAGGHGVGRDLGAPA